MPSIEDSRIRQHFEFDIVPASFNVSIVEFLAPSFGSVSQSVEGVNAGPSDVVGNLLDIEEVAHEIGIALAV